MREIIKKVKQWTEDRNLHTACPIKQHEKLKEEVQELKEALEKKNLADTVDAIGDIQVVLIVMCRQIGLDYDECLNAAYEEIKDRKGKMIDGIFVKEEDL